MTGRYFRVGSLVIRQIQREPSRLLNLLYPEPEPDDHRARYLDIDKTWHIIHFLLNAHPWEGDRPLFDAVLGGSELTEEDLGYGPARFLMPVEVMATAKALERVSPDELWSRFDETRAKQAEIYWGVGDEGREYALTNYDALQRFFAIAAQREEAMILWLA